MDTLPRDEANLLILSDGHALLSLPPEAFDCPPGDGRSRRGGRVRHAGTSRVRR